MVADIIVLCIIAALGYLGYKKGFIRTISKLICLVVSFVVAKFLYSQLAEFVTKSTLAEIIHKKIGESSQTYISEGSPEFLSKIGDYTTDGLTSAAIKIICVIAIILITYLIGRMILATLNMFSKLPVISFVNRFAGLIIGIIIGFVIVYVVISAAIFMNPENSKFWLDGSVLAEKMYRENIIMNFIIS